MSSHPGSDIVGARLPTGIDGLDVILQGGLMRGGIYIVQGSPGAGKTILTNQVCFHHVAAGGFATYVTLLAENHARMMDNMRGLAFFDESQIPDRLVYESAFAEMSLGGLDGLLRLLRQEIQRRRTSLLVVDGLVSAHTAAAGDQAFKEFVHALQQVALITDCTMLLTTNDSRAASPEQTMVDGLIALTAGTHGWDATSNLQVTKFRGSGFLRGRHSYKITDLGVSVHPRIEARFAIPSRDDRVQGDRVRSGIANLDDILEGGLPESSTTLLAGPSGIGKTTLGLHFLACSSEAEPGLLFGLHETPSRLVSKAERFGLPFEALEKSGVLQLMCQTPQSDLLDAHAETLLSAVGERNVKRLFIDGLTAFRRAITDPTRTEAFFSTLLNELRVRGVTTVVTLELPDILSSREQVPIDDVSSLTENVVLMRFLEGRERLHRVCSVVKVRDSAFEPSSHEFSLTSRGWVLQPDTFKGDVLPAPADGVASDRSGRRN